ncbi:MAG: homocysteine S-methyltransferase family protein [Sedimentisphaerales bacterium]|nr:homocysteine S-methyltransferase family protein [Sedimentisphaerales bacterium]
MKFSEALKSNNILLLDGATGTELAKRGLMGKADANLVNPDIVLEVQQEYARCGCDAIIANTFMFNPIYVKTHDIDAPVRESNKAGVEISRKAVGQKKYVLGDISSTGQLLEPYGTFTQKQFYDSFREQAGYLAEAGADAFLIETIFDLREALCALKACKENYSLPVIVTIVYKTEQQGGRTMMGDSAQQCAKELTDNGADAIGANCGSLTPHQTAMVIAELRKTTSLPLAAKPNAGIPRLEDERTIFDMTPEIFVKGIQECIDAGATLVGGCCGTTPEHIRAVANMLKKIINSN